MASGRGGGRSSSRSSSSRSSRSSSRSSFSSSRIRHRSGFHSTTYGGSDSPGGAGILMGIIFIIFPLFVGVFMFLTFFPGLKGELSYDDNDFQDYCNEIYYDEFTNYGSVEDYLLLVIAVDDKNYYDYYYMAFAGDHISADVRNMLGDNYSVLGLAFSKYMNSSSYKYSLDSDVIAALDKAGTQIENNKENIYICKENHSNYQSNFENKTNIILDDNELNKAAKDFTNKTGIPLFLVIEDINAVYKTKKVEIGFELFFIPLFVLIFVGAGVFLIVTSVKGMKKEKMNKKTTANIGGSNIVNPSSSLNSKIIDEDDYKIDPNDY